MIRLVEELTGKEWHFDTAMPGSPPFMFTGFPWTPGFYTLANSSGADVEVVLFGQSFLVPDQTKWRFMAHQNLEEARRDWAATGPVGKQFPYGGANIPSTGP